MESDVRVHVKAAVRALQKASSPASRFAAAKSLDTALASAGEGDVSFVELLDSDACAHIARAVAESNMPFGSAQLHRVTRQIFARISNHHGPKPFAAVIAKLSGTRAASVPSLAARGVLSVAQLACTIVQASKAELTAESCADVIRLQLLSLHALYKWATATQPAEGSSTIQRLFKTATTAFQQTFQSHATFCGLFLKVACKPDNDDCSAAGLGVVFFALQAAGKLPFTDLPARYKQYFTTLAVKNGKKSFAESGFDENRAGLLDAFVRTCCGSSAGKLSLSAADTVCWIPFYASLSAEELTTTVAPVFSRSIKGKVEAMASAGPVLLACGGLAAAAEDSLITTLSTHAISPKDDIRDFAARLCGALAENAAIGGALSAKIATQCLEVITKKRGTVPLWQARHGLVSCIQAIAANTNNVIATSDVQPILVGLVEACTKDTNEVVKKAAILSLGSWMRLLAATTAGAGATASSVSLPREVVALFVEGLKSSALVGASDGYAEALYAATRAGAFAAALGKNTEIVNATADFVSRSASCAVANAKKTPAVYANCIFAVATLLTVAAQDATVSAVLGDIRISADIASQPTAAASKTAAKDVKKPATTAGKAATSKPTASAAATATKVYGFWDLFNAASLANCSIFSPASLNMSGKSVADAESVVPALLALVDALKTAAVAFRSELKAFTSQHVESVLVDLRMDAKLDVGDSKAGEDAKPKAKATAPFLGALISLLVNPSYAVRRATVTSIQHLYAAFDLPQQPLLHLLVHALSDRLAKLHEHALQPSFSNHTAVRTWNGVGDGPVAANAFLGAIVDAKGSVVTEVNGYPIHNSLHTKSSPGALVDRSLGINGTTCEQYRYALKSLFPTTVPAASIIDPQLLVPHTLMLSCHPLIAGSCDEATGLVASSGLSSSVDSQGVRSGYFDPEGRIAKGLWKHCYRSLSLFAGNELERVKAEDAGMKFVAGAPVDSLCHDPKVGGHFAAWVAGTSGIWSSNYTSRMVAGRMLATLMSGTAWMTTPPASPLLRGGSGGSWIVTRHVIPTILSELKNSLSKMIQYSEDDLRTWRTAEGTVYVTDRTLSPFEENPDKKPLSERSVFVIDTPATQVEDWVADIQDELEHRRKQHAQDVFSSAAIAARSGKGSFPAMDDSKPTSRMAPPPAGAGKQKSAEDPAAALLASQHELRREIQQLYERTMGALAALRSILSGATPDICLCLIPEVLPILLPLLSSGLVRQYTSTFLEELLAIALKDCAVPASLASPAAWVHALAVIQTRNLSAIRTHHTCHVDDDMFGGAGLDLSTSSPLFRHLIHALYDFFIGVQSSESALSSFTPSNAVVAKDPKSKLYGTVLEFLMPVLRSVLTANPPLPYLQNALQLAALHLAISTEVANQFATSLVHSKDTLEVVSVGETAVTLPFGPWERASMQLRSISEAVLAVAPETPASSFRAVYGHVSRMFTSASLEAFDCSALKNVLRYLCWRHFRSQLMPVLLHVVKVAPRSSPAPDQLIANATAGAGQLRNQALRPLACSLHEVSATLGTVGVLSASAHVRAAALVALDVALTASAAIPLQPGSVSSLLTARLFLATHDEDADNANHARSIWDREGMKFDDESAVNDFVALLSHSDAPIRSAAARSIGYLLHKFPAGASKTLSACMDKFTEFSDVVTRDLDVARRTRAGVLGCFAASAEAKAIPASLMPAILPFIIQNGFPDNSEEVKQSSLLAGKSLIDAFGSSHSKLILPVLEAFLSAGAASPLAAKNEKDRDAQREGVVVLLGSAAKFLSETDPKLHSVLKVLVDTLNTPSEAVQRSVAQCLPPLCKIMKTGTADLVEQLMTKLLSDSTFIVRRGAAFGLAGAIRGIGLTAFKKYNVLARLEDAIQDAKNENRRQSALFALECLAEMLGILFEPYVTRVLPQLLKSFGDNSADVREAAQLTVQYASKSIMSILTAHGVRLVVPATLTVLNETSWRSKHAAIQLLGFMAFCAPKQLGALLPQAVPRLCSAFDDAHPKVQAAGREALQAVGSVIKNPEVRVLVPTLLAALADGSQSRQALEALANTSFVHAIDPPSLALIMPILIRGLGDRSTAVKESAAAIVGNLCALVASPDDLLPYLHDLVPSLKSSVVDPIPDVRAVAARAFGSLIRGIGEASFTDLVPWLVETMQSDTSTVERSGAAQGMSEVLTALGEPKLSQIVTHLLPLATSTKAAAREGALWLMVFLPAVMGHSFSALISLTLPAVLQGLADEVETVRDVALRSGKVVVRQHAKSDSLQIIPSLEAGLFSTSWRIRQSSVQLLGDLIAFISGGHHYTANVVAGNTDGITDDAVLDDEFAEPQSEDDELLETAAPEPEEEPEPVVEKEAPAAKESQGGKKDHRNTVADAAAAVKRKRKPEDADGSSNKREDRKAASTALGAKKSGKDAEQKLAAARARASEAGELDETYSVQAMDAAAAAVVRTIGLEARNRILAALYMVRCDMSAVVRQSALKVWKETVQNTPRVLKEVLPALMKLVIQALAQESGERRLVAGRCLGDVVRKLGDRVLPEIVPILRSGLKSPVGAIRCGVCLGLAETIEASSRKQIESHMEVLMPAVRDALCDEQPEVRDAAARAFNILQTRIGSQAVEEVVPTLLNGIDAAKEEAEAVRLIGGLQNITALRSREILPFLLPKLLDVPITASHAKALAAVATVTGSVLHQHINIIIASFIEHIDAMCRSADEVTAQLKSEVGQAAATVVQSVTDVGIAWTIGEIVRKFADPISSHRRFAAWLLGSLIAGTNADFTGQISLMFKELLARFVDTDEAVLLSSWETMCTLVNRIPAEDLPEHLEFIKSMISSLVSEARFRKGGIGATATYYLPGFCVPKGLDAVLPIYLRALMNGTTDQRQMAAIAIGEAVEVTSPDAMKPFYVKITGPLIRIVADKFPWQVKSAILSTINMLIEKGAAALRPFQPQLQATFSKSLTDPTKLVRTQGAVGLGKLMPLAARADPLVNELCGGAAEGEIGIRESFLEAMIAVFRFGGEKVTAPVRAKAVDTCALLLSSEDRETRRLAGAAMGAMMRHAEAGYAAEVLGKFALTSAATAAGISAEEKDGRTSFIKGGVKYAAATVAPLVQTHVLSHLLGTARDADADVRSLAAAGLGYLLANTGDADPAAPLSAEQAAAYKAASGKATNALVSLLEDEDADVRKAAIDALKRFARYAPSVAIGHAGTLTPLLTAFITKEGGNMVLRSAAERALIYLTNVHKDEAQLNTVLASVDAALRAFLNDFARKVLRKMDVDSDEEDSDE